MNSKRLGAFSNGVLAIIITIMVMELEVPDGRSLAVLKPLLPIFLTYVMSFVYVGIYWNNHHHLLQVVNLVNGKILWANMNLLFWLSLFPFSTGWMGQNHFQNYPTALYGIVLLMAAASYKALIIQVIKNEDKDSKVAKVYTNDRKLNASILLYITGITISFFRPIISLLIYLLVGLMWIIPDKRIERAVDK